MKKKRRMYIVMVICFIFITGILYTVTFIKPWQSKGILLDGKEVSAKDPALEATSNEKEEEVLLESHNEVTKENTPVKLRDIYIHICGAVVNPGVYEVEEGRRLCDVVDKAGGLVEDAAKDFINLAQVVMDGNQYYIPTQSDVKKIDKLKIVTMNSGLNANTDKTTSNEAESTNHLVNINTASKDELMTLNGIGEARAEAIIAYRDQFGPFQRVDDIMNVAGIKEGAYEKIKDAITV